MLIEYMYLFIFSDTSPLLNKTGSEHMFETMEMEIEQLLSKVCLGYIPFLYRGQKYFNFSHVLQTHALVL